MSPVFAVYHWLHPDFMAIAGVVVGLLTLVVAGWIAIRQMAMMHEQTASAIRQEAITKRQGEIAEAQHQTMRSQLSRTSMLRVRFAGQKQLNPAMTQIELDVINGGNKGADCFRWELFIPDELNGAVLFVDRAGNGLPAEFAPFPGGEHFQKLEGYYDEKLFPISTVHIAYLGVRVTHAAAQEFTVGWRIRSDDGVMPDDMPGKIWIKRMDDWAYSVSTSGPVHEEDLRSAL